MSIDGLIDVVAKAIADAGGDPMWNEADESMRALMRNEATRAIEAYESAKASEQPVSATALKSSPKNELLDGWQTAKEQSVIQFCPQCKQVLYVSEWRKSKFVTENGHHCPEVWFVGCSMPCLPFTRPRAYHGTKVAAIEEAVIFLMDEKKKLEAAYDQKP